MSSLLLATAANVRAFRTLSNALDTSEVDSAKSIDREALDDETGRFRVWCGNLGALQKGHSSLEYRLRDSPLLSSNTLKFLAELEENLGEASAIVSGARLPYELQTEPEEEEQEEDDDFFSEDEDEEDEPDGSRTELGMRFAEIVDIIDNLYKLSVRIRTPTIRSRSLRAAAYNPKDVETGIEIMETYVKYDKMYVVELLASLRQPHPRDERTEADFLVGRLSAAITLRRRQFKYWKRHRDKLGASTILEDSLNPVQAGLERPQGPIRNDTLEAHIEETPIVVTLDAGSQKTRKTLLSGTEATHHHQSLDEIVDNKSVTSFAVTVKDIHGRGVDLPPPPKTAHAERDFECPYCYIICPARYGRGRAWRTHLLQDLQPYLCTYADCGSSEQLFRSRREWVEHEASHRKAWRCPEHLTAVYKTRHGLEDHLRSTHMDSFHEEQLAVIAKVGETSTVDLRQKCPICHVPTDNEDVGDFQNHLANHLERIATFALPNNTEDDSDGASSAQTQGGSGITGSEITENSQHQIENESDALDDLTSPDLTEREETSRPLLSAESLQQVPDVSQNRLEMVASQLEPQGSLDDPQFEYASSENLQSEEEEVDEISMEIQEHLEQREAFRTYLMSLYGAQSVRFYRRYGSWTGQTIFKDDNAASQALRRFDKTRFPNIKITQSSNPRNKLKFAAAYLGKSQKSSSSRQSKADTQDRDDVSSTSSTSIVYDKEEDTTMPPILTLSEIPTLRTLYRSRRILQRDQSYNPNDSYNQIISFCYHDLTRLQVNAIVNSANTSIKATNGPGTLNHIVFKAAGPALAAEAKTKGKIKPGQVELTRGFDLPSSWVIHAARPRYSGIKGMGQFNVLTECYRSALKMASMYELKSLALPCLGTGGCGFPSRVAARIALQEVREYLDAHPDHGLERIIFCVKSASDEKAYIDFFPVFFPPTHGDLEVARSSEWSANRAALAAQVLESRTLVQKIFEVLSTDFSLAIEDFDERVLSELSGIDSALAAIRGFLLGPKELKRSPGDLNLICSVMQTVCESITEITEQAKDTSGTAPKHKIIWNDYNADMTSTHGIDLASFLVDCNNFVQCLADILTLDGVELDEMSIMRQTLETFKVKQVGQDAEGIRDHLDEVLYTSDFRRESLSHSRELVKIHQILSVSRLYQLGDLEAKPTLAFPSALFNHTVCLVREDITNLEVDIIVNSTDITFAGMGTLDRTVFKKGGFGLRQQVLNFVNSTEIVHVTPGYLLPAKHIFHVIPPNVFSKEAKDNLRKLYREVLHTAVLMRATSIAIPSIGTGMLNYPRRDCVSLAMEEVKRFLESAEPTSLLEKIIFVVFSSNDEFIYKSLLPTYFPPKEYGTQQLPAAQSENPPVELMGDLPATDTSPPRRTLFGSLGDAFRSVRFGKQPEISREINTYEERALIEFESHAKDCVVCKDINQLYLEGRDLCETGYPLAQMLLWSMNMSQDQTVQIRPDPNGQRTRLEVPTEIFPRSLTLLSTVEKSFRDENRTRPFVSQNRNYATAGQDQEHGEDLPPGVTIHRAEVTMPIKPHFSGGREKARAEVATYSDLAKRWDPLISGDCSIHIYPGKIEVYESDFPSEDQVPLVSLQLTPSSTVARYASNTELLVSNTLRLKSVLNSSGDVLFRSHNAAGSETLLEMLQRAMHQSKPSQAEDSYPEWNKKLHGIREEIALKEQREGRLSPLQGKLQSLTEATVNLMSSSPRREGTEQSSILSVPSQGPSISIQDVSGDQTYGALATQILEHLTTDLKTRPGSYIGQDIADIAMALKQPVPSVSDAVQELAAARRVHNTMDENTWVISNPPKELPSLRQEETSIFKPDVTISASSRTEDPMSMLAAHILSYMKFVNYAPRNKNGKTVREIASALQISTAEIWPAIRELAARGDIRRSVDAETWIVTSQPAESVPQLLHVESKSNTEKEDREAGPTSTAPVVHDMPAVAEAPSYPTEQMLPLDPNLDDPNLDLASINIDDYFSYPSPFGARWTCIDKRLLDASVLIDAKEEFEETEDSLIVHHVLRRGEIRRLAEKAREIRRWEEGTREVRERRAKRLSGGRWEGKGSKGGKEGVEGEGWRDGCGEKDRRQTKLDRVLAGDMKEEELRHFTEEEEEWRGVL